MDGYKWFGQNRERLHVNAKTGSGGVGFLIKNSILEDFDVDILESSFEGILWLSLKSKLKKQNLNICVCYLPPLNSSRQIDAQSFYDCLLTSVYRYQNDGELFICGDFNSRCGDMQDFIEGVDDIEYRKVLDYSINTYGHFLIDFLISSNMCMLNGRHNSLDEYTCISPVGSSVVDYCLVTHESLMSFHDFKVTTVIDLINQT